MLFKKKKVNEYHLKNILEDFVKTIPHNTIIYFNITNKGVVNLYSNRPGILIGCRGETKNKLTDRFKKECNVKDVKIYELKYVVSNCGIY